MSEKAGTVPAFDGSAVALLLSLAVRSSDDALSYPSLKRSLTTAIAKDPFDVATVTVLGGAFLFYLAEKGTNPRVESYWDALVFVSTCLSVGYADVFARTPAGKAIAAAIMTVGPAMSGALLDRPAGDAARASNAESSPGELLLLQRVMVEKLDAILDVLRASAPAR